MPKRLRCQCAAIDNGTEHASVFTAEVIAGLVTDAKAHYAAYVEAGVDGMHNTYPTVVTA